MSRPNRAVATGAAATVAFALLIGASAEASADRGDRDSPSSQIDRPGEGSNHGRNDAWRGDQSNRGPTGSRDVRESDTDGGAERRVNERPAAKTSRGDTAESRRATTAETSRSVTEARRGTAAPRAPIRSANPDRRGSDRRPWSAPPGTEYQPPERVAGDPSSVPAVHAPAPAVAPPPAPTITPTPSVARQNPAPRMARLEQSMLRLPDSPRPGQPMTSLFGILGLLLIPLAGAALGYRQARAARAIGQLTP